VRLDQSALAEIRTENGEITLDALLRLRVLDHVVWYGRC
jgi:hypothetical protein